MIGRIAFLFCCLCIHLNSAASPIEAYFNTEITHQTSSFLDVDAIFALHFHQKEEFKAIQSQFSSYQIEIDTYKKFTRQDLDQHLISQYCTANVSPELLAEIMSHLSIYQYCLNNGINAALLVSAKAQIKQSPLLLNDLLRELNKKDSNWDIFFTDVDYHNSNNGDFVIPQIFKNGQLQANKKKLSDHLSRVFCRYGAVSFVISQSGMKKILNELKENWIDLPFDQILFKIPGLKCYCPNSDIITNRYKEKITDPLSLVNDDVYIERKEYRVGDEFWLEPVELLSNNRFDIMAKYIYAKYYLNQYQTAWHVSLYKEHIGKWNNFYEGDPLKKGLKSFLDTFHRLLNNLQAKGFDPQAEPVPINSQGCILNGSHRVGACLSLNLPVKVKVMEKAKNVRRSPFANTMRNSHGVDEKYLDHMAFEYAKLKKNTFMVCLFPNSFEHSKVVEKLLSSYGDIVYQKDLSFNQNASIDVIRILYFNEKWVGTYENDFRQGRVKSELTFTSDSFDKPLRVYLYECKDLKQVREVKAKIRELIQIGNDSVHITDTPAQTVRIAASFFNQNSVSFINEKKLKGMPNFDRLLVDLHTYLQKHSIDPENICIDASAVLSAFGLRDCKDMDLLHKGPLLKDPSYPFDSHNGYLKYHAKGLDEVLFNPDSHFYHEGVKFLSKELLKKMKINRNEPKDIEDVQLIDSL